MKNYIMLLAIAFLSVTINSYAQETLSEKHGNTFNLGVGIGGYAGYYGYVGRTLPVLNMNYEFDVANNFTLAPFIGFYSYTREYYWGNQGKPFKNYNYHETVVPIGVKGSYYLDQLVKAGSKWDFYLAGSLAMAIVRSRWDTDYFGDKNYFSHGSTFFFDVHLGTEYHINSHFGTFIDFSTGVSTIGISIH